MFDNIENKPIIYFPDTPNNIVNDKWNNLNYNIEGQPNENFYPQSGVNYNSNVTNPVTTPSVNIINKINLNLVYYILITLILLLIGAKIFGLF
jgi:hypothetical protein